MLQAIQTSRRILFLSTIIYNDHLRCCLQWILLLLSCLSIVFCEPPNLIPALDAKGTHYQVGHQIGHKFHDRIAGFFNETSFLQETLIPWYHTKEGKQIYDNLLNAANNSYWYYVRELQGVADGANIPFYQVIMMNFLVELTALFDPDSVKSNSPDACSDVFVNNKQSCILGHNEDAVPFMNKYAYIVSVHITEGQGEEFVAYTYPGNLPGNAFGFNNHMTLTVNALYPKLVLYDGQIGRNFLTRALLAARSVADVPRVLMAEGHGAAYGLCANTVFYHTASTRTLMASSEVAPYQTTSRVAHYWVEPSHTSNSTRDVGSYSHVNMYLKMQVAQLPSHLPSSIHRTKRISELPVSQDFTDVTNVLGDTKDELYPIYRTPRPSDDTVTAATGVFDFNACILKIYIDNPSTAVMYYYTYLPCHPAYQTDRMEVKLYTGKQINGVDIKV